LSRNGRRSAFRLVRRTRLVDPDSTDARAERPSVRPRELLGALPAVGGVSGGIASDDSGLAEGLPLRERVVGAGSYAGSSSIEALGAFSSTEGVLSTSLDRVPEERGSLGTTDEDGAGTSSGPSSTVDGVEPEGPMGARSDSSTTVESVAPAPGPQFVQGRPSVAEGPT
jgi:hypothetical protein